jgi:hypothetical protein
VKNEETDLTGIEPKVTVKKGERCTRPASARPTALKRCGGSAARKHVGAGGHELAIDAML